VHEAQSRPTPGRPAHPLRYHHPRSDADVLNGYFGIPGMIEFNEGEGGLPRCFLKHPYNESAAEIYLHGAAVTQWLRPDGSDGLALRQDADFSGEVRSCVCVCVCVCVSERESYLQGEVVPPICAWACQPRLRETHEPGRPPTVPRSHAPCRPNARRTRRPRSSRV
jgi:hypothetical protein